MDEAAARTWDVASALRRLQAHAEGGGFDDSPVQLLVVHGSAASEARTAADLDVAVLVDRDQLDALGVLTLLTDVIAPSPGRLLDVMDLARAGPLARARALGPGCLALHEDVSGRFAEAQATALVQYLDTQWLRDELLESLQAGS